MSGRPACLLHVCAMSLADPREQPGRTPTKFFHIDIQNLRNIAGSGVGIPHEVGAPPGNTGSATECTPLQLNWSWYTSKSASERFTLALKLIGKSLEVWSRKPQNLILLKKLLDQGPLWGYWLPLFWTLCDTPHGFQNLGEVLSPAHLLAHSQWASNLAVAFVSR